MVIWVEKLSGGPALCLVHPMTHLGLCTIMCVLLLIAAVEHCVDDGVDVSHIDRAAAIDVGPALIVAGLVGAQQDVDQDVDVLHIDLAVQVDITRQPGCPASAAATIIIRMISLRM